MAEEQGKKKSGEDIIRLGNKYALLLHFVGCLLLYFAIEWMARHSFAQTVNYLNERTKVFLYNSLLIFMTTLPVFLFRRRVFWRALIFVFWMTLGIGNGILLANRVTPLTGPDLKMMSEGVGVLGKYMSKSMENLLIGVLIAVGIALVVFFIKGPRYKGKRDLRILIPALLAASIGFYGLTHLYYHMKQLSTYFGNIAFAYQDYGFPYCLLVTVADTGIDEPQDYSSELIMDIIGEEGELEPGKTEDLPNVIIVQLETFFDPVAVNFLEFSEDPLPNWHALSEEYTSGLYTVPTVGAGTVNTEFETLTGMSLRYFGAGEYPFKGVLKENTCESVGYVLGDLGLTAHAVHNNYATFYSRKTVYSNLGFNDFTSNEYMDNQDDVNEIGWMRDRTLIPYIDECLGATRNRDFVFVVSVQGHGAYPTEEVLEDPAIEVTGAETEEKNCQWEYYVNSLHEMDQFVKDLIDDVDKRGEPTVIMFYGDHLPTMGLSDSDLIVGSTFQTRYLVWDNIGLTQEKRDICAYQAVARMFDRMGLHEGTMFRFHQTMQENEFYQLDLQTLQYDILYGKKYVYGQSDPFSRKAMAMGIKRIELESLEQVSDDTFYVHGRNFTQSSKLIVSGKWYPTSFIDSETLLVTNVEVEDGAMVRVGQLSNSNSGKFLSYTNTIMYLPPEKSQILGLPIQGAAGADAQPSGDENAQAGDNTDATGDAAGATPGDTTTGNTDNEVIN